ncbi:hypothetical protein FXN61_24080 [Lentzea sp. PSKA42]|uniref:Uncharacterized protein n=1 Tax=Lentzea indica TaxID=2604800 RepID=A0ABX1FLR4_9PSEU|nr:hypothetical protein [Lentzea indica]NKE59719.1 hypothetical protein [Lentzea indica]
MKGIDEPANRLLPDDTTRYLCIAARTDERFSERMINALLHDDLHAAAPSVGFSLRPVLLHALAGVRQRRVRAWCLLVATALALVLSPLWTIIALLVILVRAEKYVHAVQ